MCSNFWEITLLSLPGKVYARVLERRVWPIVEPQIQEEQCGFRPGHGTVDQLFTLTRVLEGAWELAQPVYMCFVDLENLRLCTSRHLVGCALGIWGGWTLTTTNTNWELTHFDSLLQQLKRSFEELKVFAFHDWPQRESTDVAAWLILKWMYHGRSTRLSVIYCCGWVYTGVIWQHTASD